MDGFNKSDHEQILSYLTDDVLWEMQGQFHLIGKDAFDKEIENDAFIRSPTITVTRMTEENDVVVAEGSVRCAKKDGGLLNAIFCDVLIRLDGKAFDYCCERCFSKPPKSYHLKIIPFPFSTR